jgi:hypothetical protein
VPDRLRVCLVLLGFVFVPLAGITPGWPPVSAAGPEEYASGGDIDVLYRVGPNVGLPRNSAQFAHAQCPEGYSVIGGGFEIAPSAVLHPPHVYRSSPELFEGKVRWKLGAFNPSSGSGPAGIAASVNCLRRGSDLTRVQYLRESGNVPPASRLTIEARCQEGYEVVGGGFELAGSVKPDSPPHMMRSLPTVTNGWAAEVYSPAKAPSAIGFKVTAICLREGDHELRYVVSPNMQLKRNSVRTVKAECPRGFGIVSGGFLFRGEQAVYPPIILNEGPRIQGTPRWTAIAVNAAFFPILTKPAVMNTNAVCLRP